MEKTFSAQQDGFRADWWRCLFEGAEDCQVVCGPDGRVREFNRKAALLFGLEPSGELSLESVYEPLTSAAGRKLEGLLRQPASHQETIVAVPLQSRGRLKMMTDVQVTALSGGCCLVAFKDASRRWRLETHAQRLMTAVDATPYAFFLTNAENAVTFVNAAFQNMTGYSIEEALGRPGDFIRAPDEAEKAAEYLAAVSAGSEWFGELWNKRPDGSTYPVEATISPIIDRNGSFAGYVSCERDITQKRQLRDALLWERNFIDGIINSIDSVIYTLDRNFRLMHVNEGWRKLPVEHGWLNLRKQPLAGERLLDYVAEPAKRAEIEEIFRTVISTGQTREIRAGSAGGRHWHVRISPLRNGGGVAGLIYLVTDQTDFHHLQKQLYQAQKMETIGALAAGVAHDFNNLLQAIRGNSSLLLMDSGVPVPLRRNVNQIDQAASRASEITRQLLSFSRVTEETVTVFDLNQVVHETSVLARRNINGKVELRVAASKEPAKVKMDSTRASQFLLNLCVNAQDAMPDGGRLTIATGLVPLTAEQGARVSRPPGTVFVRCSVADTGTGIPPELLSSIFEPFFTTKEKGKGTGLGLSIVHSVVSQAGGFLDVESQVGAGTTFHVYLPLADAPLAVKPAGRERPIKRHTGRVMVVDDVDLVLDFTRSLLEMAGFEVIAVSDGQKAMEVLDNDDTAIDVLFTDFNMPGMNGMELIREAARRRPGIKSVLVSGCLTEAHQRQAQSMPQTRTLTKPYPPREALNLLEDLIGNKAQQSLCA